MLIAHLTDLHVRPRGKAAYRVAETNMLSERAIDAVRRLEPSPDSVIISGDLTDCGLVEEYELLRVMLARLSVPIYLIPGNHDRRENLKSVFADYPGIVAHPQYVQYAIPGQPVRLIALDTVVPGKGYGALCREQLDWLADELSKEPHAPTVIFMHHPPFVCGIEHMDRIRLIDGAGPLAEILASHPQVERVLCGHHHRSIHVRWAGTIVSTGPSVAHQVQLDLAAGEPGALVLEPAAYQLHLWIAPTGLVTHMAYVERFDGPYPFTPDPDYPGMGS